MDLLRQNCTLAGGCAQANSLSEKLARNPGGYASPHSPAQGTIMAPLVPTQLPTVQWKQEHS